MNEIPRQQVREHALNAKALSDWLANVRNCHDCEHCPNAEDCATSMDGDLCGPV